MVDVIHKQKVEQKQLQRGNEQILLVEDDEYLAEAEQKMLEELGYKVTKMTSSIEALEMFQKLADRFDIIITDLAMPKMTGLQLIRKIRPLRPDIPVIICTGYNKLIQQQNVTALKIGEVIMKPIELGHFANSIRRLLDKN